MKCEPLKLTGGQDGVLVAVQRDLPVTVGPVRRKARQLRVAHSPPAGFHSLSFPPTCRADESGADLAGFWGFRRWWVLRS